MERTVIAAVLGLVVASAAFGEGVERQPYHAFAERPTLGWNSWDCWGTQVTEEQTLANAEYMVKELKPHGWDLITVDIQWYEPQARGLGYRKGAVLEMDEYGRLLPAGNKFPSSKEGRSFKPLADKLHGMGLRFGLHLMRGIPRQAVEKNTPILGTPYHAKDIANMKDMCPWNPDMYGVDMTKPGAQEYYDSVLALMASWDLDFIKIDDLSAPTYHEAEVGGYRKAIDKSGRKIVFSTSPGATPLAAGPHVATHANQWRISDDFWDQWPLLKEQFERLDKWTPYRGTGHFPDADMLPLGNIRAFEQKGWTRFTEDEARTMMSLWSIARSPLIVGGHLPNNDEFTLSLLTNDEVLAVDQKSTNNRQLWRKNDLVAWVADAEEGGAKYVGLFNAQDRPFLVPEKAAWTSGVISKEKPTAEVAVDLKGAKTVWLAVDDAGDGYQFDHADWVNPRFVTSEGEKVVTEVKWKSATAGYDRVRVNRAVGNRPMKVGGKDVPGIGTHANSMIVYEVPEGATKLVATAALDDSGAAGSAGNPKGSTMRFYVFTEEPAGAEVKAERVAVALKELGVNGAADVRDLWTGKDLGTEKEEVGVKLSPHASALLKVTPVK